MIGSDEALRLELQADLEGNVSEKLEQIDNGITKVGADANRLEPQLTRFPVGLYQNVNQAAADLNKLKLSLNGLARSSKYVFAGLSASAGLAVKKYADFEAGILKVRTISDKSFKDIKKSAEELSVKYGISVGQITEGNYQLVSSMGDVSDAQSILDTTAKLSVAGFTDYASAMNGLVAVINGYKMSSKDAGQVADILMTVQNRGITTVNELQGSLGRVTGIANTANVSFKNLAGALATITSNKIETSEAITSLRGAFVELTKSGTQASENFQKATGQVFTTFMNNHDLADAMEALEKYANKTGKSLNDMFGSVEAGTALTNLAGTNLKKFRDNLDAVNNSAGTADEAFNKLSEGAKQSFSRLREQVNKSARDIGEALIPQVKELTRKLEQIDWKKVFSQENINKIVKTGKVIGGVAGGIWALNTAVKAVDSILKTGAGIKILMSLIGNKLFQKVLISGGSTAFSSLGITTPAKYGIGLSSAGMGVVGATGVGLAAAGTYYGNKAIKNTLGKSSEIKGNISKEKIANINEEFKKIDSQIKSLKESNDDFENVALTKSIEVLKKKKEELKLIRDELLEEKITYSNDGYLTQARGTSVDNLKGNKIDKNDDSVNLGGSVATDEIKNLMQEYQQFMTNQPKIWSLLGVDEKSQLEEKLSFLKSSIKSAVENGATNLIPTLKNEFDKTSAKLTLTIKKIDFKNAKKKLEQELKNISSGVIEKGKKDYISNLNAKDKVIEEFLNTVGEGTNGLEKTQIEEIKVRKREIQNIKKTTEQKMIAEQKMIGAVNLGIKMLSQITIGNSSQKNGTLNAAIDNTSAVLSMAGPYGQAAATVLQFTKQLQGKNSDEIVESLSPVAALLGASGHKKKAKIEAENQRQLKLYKENSSKLEKLTESIKKNSKTIESFSEKLTGNIARNPTFNRIAKGEGSFGSLKKALIENKDFGNISAVEKGRKSYRKWYGKKKHITTYTNRLLEDDKLLEYLGFNGDAKKISEAQLNQLVERAKSISTEDLKKAMGKNYSESNVKTWAKNVEEYAEVIKNLNTENGQLFKSATMGAFVGIDYKTNLQLAKEYKEMLKDMGIEGEQYRDVIKSMVDGNNLLVTSMIDVRNASIESFTSGKGGFVENMSSYFQGILKNATNIAYDISFSDTDEYFSKAYENIANNLVDIKKKGKLDFSEIFNGFDFGELKIAEAQEQKVKKSLNSIREQLFNSGIDLSIVNKILPSSDFTRRINELQQALSNAMNSGIQEHSFDSFTKTLGQSLYDNTKNSLIKAFSESKLYQGLISKFINFEDIQKQIEEAGSFKKAYELMESKLQSFGYRMEANGFGGFDAINNKADMDSNLGNAYYQDKASNVNINVTNNFNREVYGLEDFVGVIRKTTQDGIKEFFNKPKVLA